MIFLIEFTLDINGWWLAIIIAAILYTLLFVYNKFSDLKEATNKKDVKEAQQEGLLREKDLLIQAIQTEMKGKAQDMAIIQFEQWKQTELEGYKKKADAAAEFTSKIMLQRWLIENEGRIRKDAANRSVRNVMGKVAEHLIPFSEAFSEFNPKDARFIGSPIDLIVFDGAEEKKDEITIFFLEVKTGTSALSPRQKKIMEAVNAKRVEWRRLTITDFGSGVNDLLLPPS